MVTTQDRRNKAGSALLPYTLVPACLFRDMSQKRPSLLCMLDGPIHQHTLRIFLWIIFLLFKYLLHGHLEWSKVSRNHQKSPEQKKFQNRRHFQRGLPIESRKFPNFLVIMAFYFHEMFAQSSNAVYRQFNRLPFCLVGAFESISFLQERIFRDP